LVVDFTVDCREVEEDPREAWLERQGRGGHPRRVAGNLHDLSKRKKKKLIKQK
jgi:hypothetical protein